MKHSFLTLILVLLSNGNYINTDYIQFIDVKDKWINMGRLSSYYWYFDVTEKDIENIKDAMGVYGGKK